MINGISSSLQAYGYGGLNNYRSGLTNENKFAMEATKVNSIVQKVSTDEPLDYYYEFVKKYPDISFRLSDKSSMENPCYGYNNHTNQVGNNFSNPSQISVEIDVAVIRRMMKDDQFANQVNRLMQNYQIDYSQWQKMGLSDGNTNFCILLEEVDWGTGVAEAMIRAPYPFYTEEQSRALNAMYDTSDNKYLKMLAQRRDELEEDFMKMVAERQEDRLTYEQIREKWDREYQKTYSE
ncbi:MAG: hypothetical protein E7278_07180 [Lachnospiraceae bacterium]|jgi:hypothetical protein|nr:hypothetical protein [Lachnospiraceae bacterium]